MAVSGSGKKKKVFSIIIISVLAVLGLTAGVATGIIYSAVSDVTIDIGSEPERSFPDMGILSGLCSYEPDISEIDSSKEGQYILTMTLFGFLRKYVTVSVADITPPVLETVKVVAVTGYDLQPADFICLCEDRTEVTYSFGTYTGTQTAGSFEVEILAEDEGENVTTAVTELTVIESTTLPYVEFGDDFSKTAAEISAILGFAEPDLSEIDSQRCGEYNISSESDGTRYFITLMVKDTIAPEAENVNLDIRTGEKHDASEFVRNIIDKSSVTVSYKTEPDFSESGDGKAEILLTDANGNTSIIESAFRVWSIPEIIEIEQGTDDSIMKSVIEAYAGDYSGSIPEIDFRITDSTELGEYTSVLHGKYSDMPVTVKIVDTTPPEGTAVFHDAFIGVPIDAEEFVTDISDVSDVTVSYKTEPDFSIAGEQTVVVTLTDILSNSTDIESTVVIWDIEPSISVECGTSSETADTLYEKSDDEERKAVNSAALKPGEYTFSFDGKYETLEISVKVEDTTPPVGEGKNMDIMLGEKPGPSKFVMNVTDQSKVTCRFEETPDFTKPGKYSVNVILNDAYDNESTVEAEYCVWEVPESIKIECGTTKAQLNALLAEYKADSFYLTADDSVIYESLKPGSYPVNLFGAYNCMPSTLIVEDTTPPVLTLKNVTVFVGGAVSENDFIQSCTDVSSVSYSFDKKPDSTYEHTETVSITARDSSGNSTVSSATLTVQKDNIAPVIYGVTDIYALAGETISYRKNVYAVDNLDGDVFVSVDTTSVNTSVDGTYTVIYSAKDKAGNIATAKAYVVISDISQAKVDQLADNVLSGIIGSWMTDRDKAYAVYSWAYNNIRYSTATSYLMGYYVKAAYSGFTTYAGNCYVYFSVCKAMLDRLGIENMMIQRDKPDHPHYWNLVKIDGNWYHLDATNHSITTFLLTDAEVAYYSTYTNPGYYSFDSSLYPATP